MPPRGVGRLRMTCWHRLDDWQVGSLSASLHRALLDRLVGAGQLSQSWAAFDGVTVTPEQGAS